MNQVLPFYWDWLHFVVWEIINYVVTIIFRLQINFKTHNENMKTFSITDFAMGSVTPLNTDSKIQPRFIEVVLVDSKRQKFRVSVVKIQPFQLKSHPIMFYILDSFPPPDQLNSELSIQSDEEGKVPEFPAHHSLGACDLWVTLWITHICACQQRRPSSSPTCKGLADL